MADTNLIEKAQAQIREKRFTTLLTSPKPGVYVFFSFDLVNSTQFKSAHPTNWVAVVTRFYELIVNELITRISSVLIWKFVGDEVLFFKRVSKPNELHQLLAAAHSAMLATVEVLHNNFPHSRELLGVKGTIWIAEAEPVKPSATESISTARNLIVETGRYPDNTARDFLGPDIDVGFRISKYALRQRLVVSAELACLLYRYRTLAPAVEKELQVVSFETLKGVWGGRHYPIVWHEADWRNVPDSFLYDEALVSPLAKSVRAGLPAEAHLKTVDKVFSDLGRTSHIDTLQALLEKASTAPDPEKIEIEIPKDRYAEVHCVAVCFDPEGRVLLGRRPATKRRYPGALEFGCGQLKLGESFADCLKRAYRDDFGAEISLAGQSVPPVPIDTFEIQDSAEGRVIPGLIFIAEVVNPALVESRFTREKHSDVLWVRPEDFGSSNQQCVPNLARTLERAAYAWRESKGK